MSGENGSLFSVVAYVTTETLNDGAMPLIEQEWQKVLIYGRRKLCLKRKSRMTLCT